MRVGSLFSGIGGLDLGFERAGFTIAWQVEIDPYCRRVLAKHWPAVPCYEDIRDVGAHNLAPVDVLVGGFPCQDISNAGKRAGITGERSGLWSEYARLVRELRPRYVCVENVAALLHRGIDVVLGELAESGYDAEWQVLPAAAFGAPHRRDRVFIVAYTGGVERAAGAEVGRAVQRVPDNGTVDGYADRSGTAHPANYALAYAQEHAERPRLRTDYTTRTERRLTPHGRGARRAGTSGDILARRPAHSDYWAVEPDVGRVAHGVPARVDRLRALGNAVVPQVAQYVAECIREHAEAEGGLPLCG